MKIRMLSRGLEGKVLTVGKDISLIEARRYLAKHIAELVVEKPAEPEQKIEEPEEKPKKKRRRRRSK